MDFRTLFSTNEPLCVTDIVKYFNDIFAKIDKDFSYLKNPSILPTAYEKSVTEIKRRRRFRRILDDKYTKIKDIVATEK